MCKEEEEVEEPDLKQGSSQQLQQQIWKQNPQRYRVLTQLVTLHQIGRRKEKEE